MSKKEAKERIKRFEIILGENGSPDNIVLECSVKYNSWTIMQNINRPISSGIYKYNFKTHFIFILKDPTGVERKFKVYYIQALYVDHIQCMKEALEEILERSEFEFESWEHYDNKGKELKMVFQSKINGIKNTYFKCTETPTEIERYLDKIRLHYNMHLQYHSPESIYIRL